MFEPKVYRKQCTVLKKAPTCEIVETFFGTRGIVPPFPPRCYALALSSCWMTVGRWLKVLLALNLLVWSLLRASLWRCSTRDVTRPRIRCQCWRRCWWRRRRQRSDVCEVIRQTVSFFFCIKCLDSRRCLFTNFSDSTWLVGHVVTRAEGDWSNIVRRVPTRYWKYRRGIEFQNWFSRPWKSIEFSQNVH